MSFLQVLRQRRRRAKKDKGGDKKDAAGKGKPPEQIDSKFYVEYLGTNPNPSQKDKDASVECFIETYNELVAGLDNQLQILSGEVTDTSVVEYKRRRVQEREMAQDDDEDEDQDDGEISVLLVLDVEGSCNPFVGGEKCPDQFTGQGGPPGGVPPGFKFDRRRLENDDGLPTEEEFLMQLRKNIKGICRDKLDSISDSTWLEEGQYSKTNAPSDSPSKPPTPSPTDSPSMKPTGKATEKSEKADGKKGAKKDRSDRRR